ncbi:hypothetical protein [Escherichia coli]|uniref:hypothetical protein n=1 Tax=Escherichia coli TaxID=562 RepID=UPI0032DA4F2C
MESNIKGLVAAGYEMASELKAECGAVDMRSVAKLISDLATQLEVQLVRANALAEDHQKAIESIKQADAAVKLAHEKFSTLAAENAALKESERAFDEMCAEEHGDNWVSELTETPATDAFLAEVRAQGVEKLASLAGIECQRYKSVDDRAGERKWKSIVILCTDFATQLRKGAEL